MIPNPFNTNNQKPIFENFKNKSDSTSTSDIDSDSDDSDDTNDYNEIDTSKNNNIIDKSKKKQNKSGLIGEGTFGCIYDDLNNPDKVHKIFLYRTQYKEELDVAQMLYDSFNIKNIAFPKGLLLPDNISNSSLPNEITRDYLTKSGYKICKLLDINKKKNNNPNKNNSTSYKYLTYTYGGDALNNCLDSFNTVFDLLLALDNIFDAIASLESVNISHHDIKMPNLLYNKQSKETILIDYGITYKYADLFLMNPTNNKNWPVSYFVWPPEFHAIWYIMKHKYVPTARVMSDKVRNVVNVDEKYVPDFKIMYENNDTITEFIEFRNELNSELGLEEKLDRNVSLNNINEYKLSTYFTNNFAKKSDVYGLAMLIYAFNKQVDFLSETAMETNLSNYLNNNNNNKNNKNKNNNTNNNELNTDQKAFCKDIHNMIRKMGSPNPYKRYSAIECNADYNKYIREKLYVFKNGNILNTVKKNAVFSGDVLENIENFTSSNTKIIASYVDIDKNMDIIPRSPFAIFIIIILIITLCVLGSIYFKLF